MQQIPRPADFNLPHDDWRPHQYESIEWGRQFAQRDDGTWVAKITEQSTGSGKSSWALGSTHGHRAVVLTKSRSLQMQYGQIYEDAALLYGRNNYECIRSDNVPGSTAQDCLYGNAMSRCYLFESCPYVMAKHSAQAAQRAILNYAYWLVAHKQKWTPDILILDEAHNIPDIILDHVGTTINEFERRKWFLPDFPEITTSSGGLFIPKVDGTPDALAWLERSHRTLKRQFDNLKDADTEAEMRERRSCENLMNKVNVTKESLESLPGEHWFIRSGAEAGSYRGSAIPSFLCKPLTARYNFTSFFPSSRRNIIMSATIGDAATFAKELGQSEYDFLSVPSVWPKETRPVTVLPVPSMGHASTSKDPLVFDVQADAIADAIKACPDTWSGLVLVTRKSEASLLGRRLAIRGLQDRIWVSPGADGSPVPTNEQLVAWNDYRAQHPNAINVNWWAWEGYDGVEERIVVVAKVPFPFTLDPYEKARMEYDQKMYLQRTAWMLEQGCGRVRRGNRADYNVDGEFNTLVAIADGSWKRVQKYVSQSFRESIVIQEAK